MRGALVWSGMGILGGVTALAWILSGLPDLVTVQGLLVHRRIEAVSAPFEGKILAAYVKSGHILSPGEPMFLLDSAVLEEEKVALEHQRSLLEAEIGARTRDLSLKDQAAEAEVFLLEAELERFRKTQGLMPGREGERREAEWTIGKLRRRISAAALESDIRELHYRMEALARRIVILEEKIRRRVVCSPAEGVFLDQPGYSSSGVPREVLPGQWCSLGQPLGFIGLRGVLDLRAEAGMEYFHRIAPLHRVTVKVPAGLNGGRELLMEERVLRLLPGTKPGVFGLTVSWTPEGVSLPAGTLLEIKIPLLPMRPLP